MNRLQTRPQSQLPSAKNRYPRLNSLESLALEFPHRLFMPEHYEAGYDYPVVIWLHSHASSEYELDSVMPHLSLRNYIGLAIRGTEASRVGERRFSWGETISAMTVAEELVMSSVCEIERKRSINRQKIFLVGHGMGGTLAQWLGLRHSQTFAGVVSIHGGFPKRLKTLAEWRLARRLPVLFMVGERSELCDTDELCRSMRQVHSAGLNYQFAQFAVEDDLDTIMTETANRFMMNLVTDDVQDLGTVFNGSNDQPGTRF